MGTLDKFDLSGYVLGLNFDQQDKLYTVSNDPDRMRFSVDRNSLAHPFNVGYNPLRKRGVAQPG